MLDETIPLTAIEWEEWGNPNIEKDFHTIHAYSPYDNIKAQAYPATLILADSMTHAFTTGNRLNLPLNYVSPRQVTKSSCSKPIWVPDTRVLWALWAPQRESL